MEDSKPVKAHRQRVAGPSFERKKERDKEKRGVGKKAYDKEEYKRKLAEDPDAAKK
jgi:hypothetical protein